MYGFVCKGSELLVILPTEIAQIQNYMVVDHF